MCKYIIITLIICYCIDISGFIEEAETMLSKRLKQPCRIPKPFSCGTCMTWWTLLAIELVKGPTLKGIAFAALCAFMADTAGAALLLVKRLAMKIIDIIGNILKL